MKSLIKYGNFKFLKNYYLNHHHLNEVLRKYLVNIFSFLIYCRILTTLRLKIFLILDLLLIIMAHLISFVKILFLQSIIYENCLTDNAADCRYTDF